MFKKCLTVSTSLVGAQKLLNLQTHGGQPWQSEQPRRLRLAANERSHAARKCVHLNQCRTRILLLLSRLHHCCIRATIADAMRSPKLFVADAIRCRSYSLGDAIRSANADQSMASPSSRAAKQRLIARLVAHSPSRLASTARPSQSTAASGSSTASTWGRSGVRGRAITFVNSRVDARSAEMRTDSRWCWRWCW